jgi:hypothetical protein
MITNKIITTTAPGVDDHLHRGEELRLLGDEQHRDAEEGGHQAQRGVHGVRRQHHAQRTREADAPGDEEDEQLHQASSSAASSGGFTPKPSSPLQPTLPT